MTQEIQPIIVPFILNISVNCYLVKIDNGFVLIDTAKGGQRLTVENALYDAGVTPGNLKLIILTHGDFDHCGNAAYLSQKYGAPVAMHKNDSGMVEHGDITWNRNQPNIVMKSLMGMVFRLSKEDRFTPDFYVEAGDTFDAYGFDAEVIALPGHSSGNIGILTAEGNLFCGDLLGNTKQPEVWSIIDDKAEMYASVEKLRRYDIDTVYPGHGWPFKMADFFANYQMPVALNVLEEDYLEKV